MTKHTDIFRRKNERSFFKSKSFSHFFNKKYCQISDINVWNFNEMLTNEVVPVLSNQSQVSYHC